MRSKQFIITTGALLLLAVSSPIVPHNISIGTITAQAAELPYSANWETQADGSWKYKLSSGGYASGWIQDEVDHNWYYMDSTNTMLSGLVKSNNNHYYLLSQEHDGHFGRMLINGSVYKGITIQADTSEAYRGALSQTTLAQLRSLGLTVESARDVSGSQHVSDGQVVSTPQQTTPSTSQSGGSIKVTTDEQGWFDMDGDGYLTGDEYTDYTLMQGVHQDSWDDGVNIS